jgi:type II secretory pathway predicted ATPase ExeA
VSAQAILLTGGVGSGKTTVLLALGELLEERDEPYALVDLDWLAWLRPAYGTLTVHDALVANLAATWETFRRAGVETLVLARHVSSAEELAAIRRAIPDVALTAVRLTVPADLREERLRARDTGRELEQHLELLSLGEAALFEDATVANDRAAREVARDLLRYAVSPTGQDTPVPPSPQ